MKEKLSQKEKGEIVTKGYLGEYIESKDFATRDYVLEMFEVFEKRITQEFKQEFKQHTSALMEFQSHQTQLIIEALLSRIERVEVHVGLSSI